MALPRQNEQGGSSLPVRDAKGDPEPLRKLIHELNQPLSAILTYAGNGELLLAKAHEGGPDPHLQIVAQNLAKIKEQVHRIQTILDLSRWAADAQEGPSPN